ncbi:lytic transglycosylase domain-containing protein [Propioniciclava soli]|uniref:lytic transglycosylase domain-containing protein n=1 Tax=Propioniciclava soli TaxID=2775081 RepID=UPI001E41F69F|nr:lytic murein transglycosylase [Propioniciclava soli]
MHPHARRAEAQPPRAARSTRRRAAAQRGGVVVGVVALVVLLGGALALQAPGPTDLATPAPSPTPSSATPAPPPPERPPLPDEPQPAAAGEGEESAGNSEASDGEAGDGGAPVPGSTPGTPVAPGGTVGTPTSAATGAPLPGGPASTGAPTQPVATSGPVLLVDEGWLLATAAATGIPARALDAYGTADLTVANERPNCSLGWNTLAGIGFIESRHGSFGGSVLGGDGVVRPPIVGVALDGGGVAHIPDSDGGRLDGDAALDRAVGPMQFIPATWARWGADANGDGVADPQNIDDAALAAARYLCASGDLTTSESWRRAILTYNRSDAYVANVAEVATRYARASQG